MPNKIVEELINEVKELRKDFTNHLIESGGIKVRLNINTWLTLAIFGALIANYFKG
jgi:hypothetical protein